MWVLRCSVRSEIRRDSRATWTSGEPVSPSLVPNSAMICFFVAASSDTRTPHSLLRATECPRSTSRESFRYSGGGDPLRAASRARGSGGAYTNGRHSGYQAAAGPFPRVAGRPRGPVRGH
ncbi:hypothetical protein SGPA1_11322 [Streptomyces misionensis JCM 4497]